MFEKIAIWYTSRAALPYWFIVATDCLIILFAGLFASVYDTSLSYVVGNLGPYLESYTAYLVCYVIGIRIFHTYTGIIRKTTVSDLARVGFAMFSGAALMWGVQTILPVHLILRPIPFPDILVQCIVATVMMAGVRIVARLFYDLYLRHTSGVGPYGYSNEDLTDMEMANLLQRKPIKVNMDDISTAIKGKSILVTGAAGSIGSELTRILATLNPANLILVDQAETPLHDLVLEMERSYPRAKCRFIVTSLCHSGRMEQIFADYKPEMVFHAAAYKHVPMMEDNPIESVLNNVDGTRKIADLSVAHGVKKFVMISTDKAVNPTNVMGCSKRICEMYCQSLSTTQDSTQFITTRFGNVLGSNGSVIPTFRDQIRRGGPVRVTHPKVTRFFMLISEACSLVLEAATIGRGGEIFVFDMGSPVRIVDLAKKMIHLSGRHNVGIEFTGLRPGEKLYEEVLSDKEKVLPTRHPLISIARVRQVNFANISRLVNSLIDTAHRYLPEETVRMMKHIVPEYRSPASSPYAAFDPPPDTSETPFRKAAMTPRPEPSLAAAPSSHC